MKRKRFVPRFEVFVPATATEPARMLVTYAATPERALKRLRTWGVGLVPIEPPTRCGAFDRRRNVIVESEELVGDPPSGVRELPSCVADQVVTSGPVVEGTGK